MPTKKCWHEGGTVSGGGDGGGGSGGGGGRRHGLRYAWYSFSHFPVACVNSPHFSKCGKCENYTKKVGKVWPHV